MADTKKSASQSDSVITTSESEFLNSSSTPTADSTNAYGDFFQETSDGNLSIGPKAQKSGIEMLTDILWYVVPLVVVVAILLSAHVFIRTRDASGFAENYQFLCPYLNYNVDIEDAGCKTMTTITQEYQKNLDDLHENIVSGLTEYIPIKISKNIIDASPEKKFILETFSKKIHPDDVMMQFNNVLRKAQYTGEQNIECSGINIVRGDTVSTQCTIYGGDIGDDDANGKLGSARIMTLRFTDFLANTVESRFILLNPPTTLSVEKIDGVSGVSPLFKTRVTIPVQLKYVPLEQKS